MHASAWVKHHVKSLSRDEGTNVTDGERFTEAWSRQSPLHEPSAAERDWAAKRRRWAALDAAAPKPKPQHPRRWYPWVVFFAVAATAVALAGLTGLRTAGVLPFAAVPGSDCGTNQPCTGPLSGHERSTPPAGQGERDHRILPAVSPALAHDGYAIARYEGTEPVGFSPCRVWPVVVNIGNAPKDAYQAVTAAVGEISAATGLALIVETTTDEPASDNRAAYQPDRYGDRWAPILVTWTTGGAEEVFAGHGGPQILTLGNGDSHYVSGQVTLDADGGFNREPTSLNAVLLHELGHVVGLDHSPDPTAIMAASNIGQTAMTPGDRTGFALVGGTDCTDAV